MKFEIILCCVVCLSIDLGQCLRPKDKDRIIDSFKYCTGNLSLLHQKAVNTEFYYEVGETIFKHTTIFTTIAIGATSRACYSDAFTTGSWSNVRGSLQLLAYPCFGFAIGFGGLIGSKLLKGRTRIATLDKINDHLDHLIFDIMEINNFNQSEYDFVIRKIHASRQFYIIDGRINFNSENIVAAFTSLLAIGPKIGELLIDHCGPEEKAHGCLSFLSDLITKNKHKLTEVFSTSEIGFMDIIAIVEVINLHSILTYTDLPEYIDQMNGDLKNILEKFIVNL
jgi:hypothetical protein